MGCGGAGSRGHIPALSQLTEKATIVGLADLAADRRADIAAWAPQVPLFASAQEMLASVTCDVLVVATQPSTHAELVALGMEHGLHVVCEKPLSVRRSEHDAIACACARHPGLALVPVHQYRYSPQWTSIARWARRAARLRRLYSLEIDVKRDGPDRHATSPWRTDLAVAGGMLADVGVHFLALAWTIGERLEPLAAARERTAAGRERAGAIVKMGSGVLTIQASNAAEMRQTRVELRIGRARVAWCDDAATASIGKRTLLRRRVDAISDRRHVDALYLSLYRELVEKLRDDPWRKRRTAEALEVGNALVTLLERAPIAAAVGD